MYLSLLIQILEVSNNTLENKYCMTLFSPSGMTRILGKYLDTLYQTFYVYFQLLPLEHRANLMVFYQFLRHTVGPLG